MRSRNRTAKLCAAILTVVMLLTSVAQFVFADEYPPREGDFTENPREGNVIMGIEGEFVTITEEEKAILLDRVNEIRKEACDEGVPSPSDRSVALTSADYVPIKWSRLIELIAAMRAVESSVAIAHQRLAVNTSVFTNNYGAPSNAENIAWNYNPPTINAILAGIEQWYDEKDDWVNGTSGAVTGHYTSMINPGMRYIGLAGFYNSASRWPMTVTNQLSRSSGLDESVAGIGGKVTQKTEVNPAYIKSLTLDGSRLMQVGETGTLTNRATVEVTSSIATSHGEGPLYSGLTWESSAPGVVAVDAEGNIEALGKGNAVITARLNDDVAASIEINVVNNVDPDLKVAAVSLRLSDSIAVRFKVPKTAFTGTDPAASDPFLKLTFCGKEYTLRSYTTEGDRYVFSFNKIAPHLMNETIDYKLYATLRGETAPELVYAADYSIVKYCTNMLTKYSDNELLRTVLVDMLNYGAAAQKYMNYNTGALANSGLTAEQKAWATNTSISYNPNGNNKAYSTITDPTVNWTKTGLRLEDSIAIRLKFTADNISGLTLKVTGGGKTWNLSSSAIQTTGETDENGDPVYVIYFRGVLPTHFYTRFLFTFMREGEAVSNTQSFEIDSYVGNHLGDGDYKLTSLLWNMFYYCKSVTAYADASGQN